MTDSELAIRVRDSGDEAALAELYRRHRSLLALWKPLGLYGPTPDEFAQVARIAIWQAARAWDPGYGREFRRFAAMVVQRKMIDAVKVHRRVKHRLLTDAAPLDTPDLAETLPVGGESDPLAVVVGRERLATFAEALSTLSELERASLDGFEEGISYVEIEGLLGRESARRAKSIDNALQRAREKIRAALADAA